MADQPEPLPPDPEPDPDETELEASEIVTDAQGNKTVSLSTMLRYKREAKTLGKRNKELETTASRVNEVEGRLNEAAPVINAILSNPKLKADALRIANHTHRSAETTEQPDDDEATAFAENVFGFYLPDGQTPDTARARRAMDLMDRRTGRQTDTKLRPLAGSVLGDRAQQNILAAKAETDDQGVPIATSESIDQVVALMGPDGQHLLANPAVKEMILNQAAGLDRRMKRTPKAQDEPLYLESAGSRNRAPVIDAEMRGFLQRQNISEKDYLASAKKHEDAVRSGSKVIPLGGK